jgi:hypothetical protein
MVATYTYMQRARVLFLKPTHPAVCNFTSIKKIKTKNNSHSRDDLLSI